MDRETQCKNFQLLHIVTSLLYITVLQIYLRVFGLHMEDLSTTKNYI